jgi:hypothetical protein
MGKNRNRELMRTSEVSLSRGGIGKLFRYQGRNCGRPQGEELGSTVGAV